MGIMSKLTASYLAGFIDGEGYISLKPNVVNNKKYFTPVIKISNTNQEIIQWIKDSFGGWIEKRVDKFNINKDSYCWTLTGKNLKPFLLKIFPYLRIKKEQCKIVLEKINNKESTNKYLPYKQISRINKERIGKMNVNRNYREDIRNKNQDLYEELRRLNKRGKNIVQPERLNEKTPNGDAIV
jgi:hypothetical protein